MTGESILTGDLKAHHTHLACNETKCYGKTLLRIIQSHNVTVSNTNTKPRRNPVNNSEELLDVVIVTDKTY